MRSPSQAVPREECAKPCSVESRQDEIETFAHTVQSASRERNIKNALAATVANIWVTWRESVRFQSRRTTPWHQRRVFSCQEMLLAQLHNLASYLGFNCVSESTDGRPTGFEEEEQDDWLPPEQLHEGYSYGHC